MRVGSSGPPEPSPVAPSPHFWTALRCSKLAERSPSRQQCICSPGREPKAQQIWGGSPGQGTEKGWAAARERQQCCGVQVPALRSLTKRDVWAKNKGRRVLQSPSEAKLIAPGSGLLFSAPARPPPRPLPGIRKHQG